jgi:hypothetical protein
MELIVTHRGVSRIADVYAVDTIGGVVWYSVTRFWAIRGWRRFRIMKCEGYREPS